MWFYIRQSRALTNFYNVRITLQGRLVYSSDAWYWKNKSTFIKGKVCFFLHVSNILATTLLQLDITILVSMKIDLILIRVFYVVKVGDKMNRNEV